MSLAHALACMCSLSRARTHTYTTHAPGYQNSKRTHTGHHANALAARGASTNISAHLGELLRESECAIGHANWPLAQVEIGPSGCEVRCGGALVCSGQLGLLVKRFVVPGEWVRCK